MSELKIINGGGYADESLPLQVGAETTMFKVLRVTPSYAMVMMATDLYDDPKWLGYRTDNHRATALLRINRDERLDITYPQGEWTYTGYRNSDRTVSLVLGNATKARAVRPDFKEHFGEQDALEVVMHPAQGSDGPEQVYLYSNECMTSGEYDERLCERLPKDMVQEAGSVTARRYPFESNTILPRRDDTVLAKLNRSNPVFREGRMEYRFIPYFIVSDDMKVITIRQVDTDFNTRFVKETEVVVDDTIESPYADENAAWHFRAGMSVQKQAKHYGLIEHFLTRAKELAE